MQFSKKNWWFQTKIFTGLLDLKQLYKQNPLEKFFIFIIYQNYTLALNNYPDERSERMCEYQI